MKTCNKCFGFGHSGKPLKTPCDKCDGTGIIQAKQRKKITYKEAKEASTVVAYIKKNYPDILVETVKHEGKKQFWEQSQHKKQNSEESYPDTRIYLPEITLMLENKANDKPPSNANGKLKDWHHQNQYDTHRKLFNKHTKVYFAVGVDHGIELFEQCRIGDYPPMQIYSDCAAKEKEDKLFDNFFAK